MGSKTVFLCCFFYNILSNIFSAIWVIQAWNTWWPIFIFEWIPLKACSWYDSFGLVNINAHENLKPKISSTKSLIFLSLWKFPPKPIPSFPVPFSFPVPYTHKQIYCSPCWGKHWLQNRKAEMGDENLKVAKSCFNIPSTHCPSCFIINTGVGRCSSSAWLNN